MFKMARKRKQRLKARFLYSANAPVNKLSLPRHVRDIIRLKSRNKAGACFFFRHRGNDTRAGVATTYQRGKYESPATCSLCFPGQTTRILNTNEPEQLVCRRGAAYPSVFRIRAMTGKCGETFFKFASGRGGTRAFCECTLVTRATRDRKRARYSGQV